VATAAAGGGAPEGAFTTSAASSGDTVTLITGDRVTLVKGADGKQAISFQAAPRGDGRPVGYTSYGDDGHLYVIPSDVVGLVPGKLDRNLFDVLALSAMAKDHPQDGLPVIVQETKAAARGAAKAPSWKSLGVTKDATLESISAVAGQVSADGAPELVDAVETPVGSVDKVWLDAPVVLHDTQSMPQIGAPAAWATGLDGTGVTVAVLDTGIDTTHPDLDGGVVSLARDFTGEGTTTDKVGHGTHVASTIAGSGEASGGAYRGVAFGAHLLNGRVLNSQGEGETSWIIDAMEWAATNGASIINMSLGVEGEYTDGTDPGSLAVDAISAKYGTLVVVAAGNDGYHGSSTVSTPGTADSALTVGAVDSGDHLAGFSSTGPRFGDAALKPDVVAPGVDIIAARASGIVAAQPFDDFYMYDSGTSMAAPHVAGAAAILKAARPDLTGPQLKAILMGSAQAAGNPVHSEGSGRIWIPGALAETVYASPASLSIGVFASPRPSQTPRTRTVTYTNPGDSPAVIHVGLSATASDGSAVPDGMVTLSTGTVTAPAHGTASVDVTIDPQADDPGTYTGALTASGPGFAAVRTVLGFTIEPTLETMRIEATQPDGKPVQDGSIATISGIDDPQFSQTVTFVDGAAQVRVPPGRYALLGWLVNASSPTNRFVDGFTTFTRDVDLTADTTVTLDGTKATPVHVTTAKKSKTYNVAETIVRQLPGRSYPVTAEVTMGTGGPSGGVVDELYVLGQNTPLVGDVSLNSRVVDDQPLLDVAATGHGRKVDVSTDLSYGVLSPHYLGKLSAPLVAAGTGTPAELAAAHVRGAVALVQDRGDETLNAQAQAAHDAGAKAVIVYGATGGPFLEDVELNRFLMMDPKVLPTLTLSRDVGLKLVDLAQHGGARLTGTGIDTPGYQYALGYLEDGIPKTLDYIADARNTAEVDVDVRAFAPDTPMSEWVTMDGGGTFTGFGYTYDGPLTGRKVYYSTDQGIRFQRTVTLSAPGGGSGTSGFDSAWVTYKPGQHVKETFFGQATHGGLLPSPTVPSAASVSRDGDQLTVNLPYRVDAAGHAQTWGPDQDTTGRFQLWAGDQQLVDSEYSNGYGEVPAGATSYRMKLETQRDVAWWPQSTDVTTEWGFTSSHTKAAAVLPLLQVRYDVKGLSSLNVGGRTTQVDLTVTHQDGSAGGAAVKSVKLWSSADGGKTWTPAKLVKDRRAAGYTATLTVPRGTTSVSLRSEASDSAGATFKETVIDAYAVGGSTSHH
jgi:subtilisin family serine protease